MHLPPHHSRVRRGDDARFLILPERPRRGQLAQNRLQRVHVQQELLRAVVAELLTPEHRRVRARRDAPGELLAEEEEVVVADGPSHGRHSRGERRLRVGDVLG